MAASSLINVCRFNPTAGGTTDWTYSSAVTGYQSPSAAGAVNGAQYSYRAESADLSQWEIGTGAYNSGTGVFARTAVLFNSAGTTAKINFTAPPQVAIVALKEDLLSVIPNYISGLGLANNVTDATNDIDIAAGLAADSTNAVMLRLASALTKRLDAGWAAGTGNGMRNSGVAIADTTYHIYLVSKAEGVGADIYAHTSTAVATVITALQAESGGSGYIYARRIGSIMREGGVIVPFVQDGDLFMRKTSSADVVSASNFGTTAQTATLKLPTGIRVQAQLRVAINWTHASSANGLLVSDLSLTDEAAAYNNAQVAAVATGSAFVNAGQAFVMTNTSAQVRYRVALNSTALFVDIRTAGWLDTRGK
ncbi:hypothetical protein [Bradyrhizobium retamae]|uniref:Chitin-binding type-3 domain-containing protein n=1 Tax=Bradyrhizobium retamae TaxID=1300035 RepID=A0A0R3MUN2_9BRAD|nr:hypothetical protein [Bradyrhizobium retamae]KRR21903.1 hypothetical protein CQ13_07660 [Bradyrhizobium retamae]